MPRPKSDLTKNGKLVALRVTDAEHEEYMKLGAGKWFRKFLRESKEKRSKDECQQSKSSV